MLSVGVDAALKFHQVEIQKEPGIVIWKSRVDNNKEGLEKLCNKLEEIENEDNDSKIIGIYTEAIGSYFEPYRHHLSSKGYRVVIINPVEVKSARKMKNLDKSKSDRIDASTLASLPWIDIKYKEMNSHKRHSVSDLTRLYQKMQRIETQLKNSLNSDIIRIFPEFVQFIKDNDSKTVLMILDKYSTPANLLEESEEKLIQLVKKESRHAFGPDYVKTIRELAENTIGVPDAEGVIEYRIKFHVKRIREIKKSINEIEKEIKNRVKKIKEIQLIAEMRGIEMIKAASIYGEIGPIEQFLSARKLQGYGGITPKMKQSGSTKWIGRPTKIANHHLRSTVSVCSRTLAKHSEEFREIYFRERMKGKSNTQAYIIISNRLLYHVFTILKNKKPYRKRLPLSSKNNPTPSISSKR